MIEFINQNFLQPLGLLALLGLIPLIIFYLVRPKPEEQVMPSMAFFTEDKKDGKARNALRTLKRNKLLLLHILFVCLLSAAIANPLIQGLESDGNSVILVDASASVNDNRKEIQEFALRHLGERNTVITAGKDPRIQLTDASEEEARSFIQNYNVKAEGTDLVSALQLASNYPGKIVLASDMDHTNTDQDLKPALNDIASERNLKVMDINHENSHGFTDLLVEGGTADITIKNYIDRNRTFTLSKPGANREVSVSGLSTNTVQVELEPGTHELVLPPDESALDNKLYVSVPEKQRIQVSYLGEPSPYFRNAVELIDFTEYNKGFIQEADVYYISEGHEIDEKLTNLIDDSDSAFILESREGREDYAPLGNFSGSREKNVQVSNELAISFTSAVDSYDVTGETLASPEEALVLSEDERVLLYNVEDDKFGQQISYPIFWKNILRRMADLKKGDDLNLRTGQVKNFDGSVEFQGDQLNGAVEIDHTGFYRGNKDYAANFLNSAEASPHINEVTSKTNIGEEPGKDPSRKYLAALLALIATLEVVYLSKKGEMS